MPSKKSILKFLSKALKISRNSDFDRQKVGCVLIFKNKIVAFGYNSKKTYPIQKKYNFFRNFSRADKTTNNGMIHAEMMCLQKTKYLNLNWEEVSLYVARTKVDGTQGLAKPCKACQKAIKERGIGTIYYSLENSGFDVL